MTEIAITWIRYFLDGNDNDYWAVERLNEMARTNRDKAWEVIKEINNQEIAESAWAEFIDSNLGCGPLEEIIALDSTGLVDKIIDEAMQNIRLKKQLSLIYDTSVGKEKWEKIQDAIGL